MQIRQCSAEEFFKTLWGGFAPLKGNPLPQIELRYTERKSFEEGRVGRIWEPITNLSQWLDASKNIIVSVPHNMHYSVCPKWSRDGFKSSVAGVSTLWADIDHIDLNTFKNRNLPRLHRAGIPPTMLVSSGWGIHIFWVFDKRLDVDDFTDAEKWNRVLAWLNGGDIQASNISHTLRFPTSYNCKALPYRRVIPYMAGKVYSPDALIPRLDTLTKSYMKNSNQYREQLQQILSPHSGSGKDFKAGSENGGKRTSDNDDSKYKKIIQEFIANKTTEEILNYFRDLAQVCPVLKKSILYPHEVEYQSWLSLGAGIYQVFGDQEGLRIFHAISSLDAGRYTEEKTDLLWGNIVDSDLKGFNCHKLTEGQECEFLASGQCKNIMPFLQKHFFTIVRQDQRDK